MFKKKSLFLMIFGVVFLVFNFWIILTPRVSEAVICRTSCNDVAIWDVAGTLNCGGNSGCFYSDVSHSSLINGGACSISKISLRLCNPINFYSASCNDVNMSCKEDNCSGLSASDGASCVVTMGTDGDWACGAPVKKIGTWDASQGKCIECSGLKESTVCADGSSIKLSNITGNCNASDNSFETACDATVSSVCDDKAQGAACNPPAGGICDATGQCVAANALSLEISLGTNPVSTGGTSAVTFTVKKNGVAESGATVTITSISCGTLPNPGSTTNASGQTTSTFTAPGATNICVVNAKAAKAGFTDGTATVSIPVSMCAGSDYVEYNNYRYVKGESIQLEGVLNAGGLGEWSLCIYNPGGSLKEDDMFSVDPAFPRTISYTSDAVGSWKGLLTAGLDTCPNSFNAAAGCLAATDVVECDDDDTSNCASGICNLSTYTCAAVAACTAPACNGTTQYCSGGSWVDCPSGQTCSAGVCSGGAEICTGGADEDGDGDVDCDDSACAADPACAAGGSSVCDPKAWFFCNTLRGTVEDIFQAGETLIGYILGLIGSIALLLIIIAGVMYMTSMGNEEKITTSKKIVTGAVIGLAIALLSYSLLQLVISIL